MLSLDCSDKRMTSQLLELIRAFADIPSCGESGKMMRRPKYKDKSNTVSKTNTKTRPQGNDKLGVGDSNLELICAFGDSSSSAEKLAK